MELNSAFCSTSSLRLLGRAGAEIVLFCITDYFFDAGLFVDLADFVFEITEVFALIMEDWFIFE